MKNKRKNIEGRIVIAKIIITIIMITKLEE